MGHNVEGLMPQSAEVPSSRQRAFLRYYTGFLIDLVVLNLFAEWWDKVYVHSFTISLLAALLLQLMLKATIAIEHRVGAYFKARPGKWSTFLRFFCAWLVLFGSKFVILEALTQVFGDTVRFLGAWHGVVALIVVVVVMLVAEELVARLYRRMG